MSWRVEGKNIVDSDGMSFLCYNKDIAEELVEYLNEKYGDE